MDNSEKIVIYTVISGNYDTLKQPEVIGNHFRYVCFTDQEFKEEQQWEIRPLLTKFNNPILVNRYHKMHPHILFPENKYSVYIDGNIQITGSHLYDRVLELIKANAVLSLITHPDRVCVYKEAEVCVNNGLDSTLRIWRYIAFLKKRQYPSNNGLIEANIIFRMHKIKPIIQLMEEWWKFFRKFSYRDQLTLPYVLWKNKTSYVPFFEEEGVNVRNHPDYAFFSHKAQRKRKTSKVIRAFSAFMPVRSWRKKMRKFRF
jgi:hypothetical protein